MLSKYLRRADTTAMLLPYFRDTDTSLLNLTSRFATKLNISDTLNMLSKYLRRADTTLMLTPYLRKADTTNMLLPYFRDADTTSLNLTNRFAAKLNLSDTLNMLSKYLRRADTTLMLTPYLRKADTTNMLLPYFRDTDTSLLNLTSRFATKLNISDTLNMLSKYLRRADTTLMLTPYLRKADTTNMLLPYFRDTDTSLLNLTSRFAAKQNTLNGLGFVKASGTDITYDNSSYLRTGLADSTYLKLTGGTLTGALNVSALSSPLTVNSTNSNTYKFNLSSSGVIDSYFGSNNVKLFSIADKNVNELFFIDTLGKVSINATGVPININSKNNNFYKLLFSNDNSITGYLGSDGSKSLSIADGSANEVAYITYLGDAAFNGNITEAGNNVLTNLDTVSLSNRIDAKYNSSGGTISGAVTLSTTSATPTSLLGKDGSNVVGTVTTLAQTGLMTRNIVTDASTISGSELINVTHGFITEPTAVLLTVFGSTSYILQVASKNSSTFTVQVKNYDGTPAINATLISFSWLAIK
jgi:predicted Zn-ribbon and HTH transcriptional regulator